ncbi:unnamed protein product [Ambrosiozyma monospora]|uniref:Unnamed protein product n=1 Tax=Ambrosiozyma monospora TaxID=43982 RepID=A0ACB5SY49_AMBMO|nr:unnamed protein product [Ambrosiozyma monospora]
MEGQHKGRSRSKGKFKKRKVQKVETSLELQQQQEQQEQQKLNEYYQQQLYEYYWLQQRQHERQTATTSFEDDSYVLSNGHKKLLIVFAIIFIYSIIRDYIADRVMVSNILNKSISVSEIPMHNPKYKKVHNTVCELARQDIVSDLNNCLKDLNIIDKNKLGSAPKYLGRFGYGLSFKNIAGLSFSSSNDDNGFDYGDDSYSKEFSEHCFQVFYDAIEKEQNFCGFSKYGISVVANTIYFRTESQRQWGKFTTGVSRVYQFVGSLPHSVYHQFLYVTDGVSQSLRFSFRFAKVGFAWSKTKAISLRSFLPTAFTSWFSPSSFTLPVSKIVTKIQDIKQLKFSLNSVSFTKAQANLQSFKSQLQLMFNRTFTESWIRVLEQQWEKFSMTKQLESMKRRYEGFVGTMWISESGYRKLKVILSNFHGGALCKVKRAHSKVFSKVKSFNISPGFKFGFALDRLKKNHLPKNDSSFIKRWLSNIGVNGVTKNNNSKNKNSRSKRSNSNKNKNRNRGLYDRLIMRLD